MAPGSVYGHGASPVGKGEAGETFITSLLEGEVKRPLQPAPAEGLVLWDTDCGIEWIPIAMDERSGSHMDHVVRHHALMANVCRGSARGLYQKKMLMVAIPCFPNCHSSIHNEP